MTTHREGGCQCGRVRYRVDGEPVAMTICHCRECQRQSGSAFGTSTIVRKDAFTILRGEPKIYTRDSDSGRPVVCAFCPECGTRIYHEPRYMDGVVNVKAGTFDDPSFFRPSIEVWTKRQHPWLAMTCDLQSFEAQPG